MSAEEFDQLRAKGVKPSSYAQLLLARTAVVRINMQLKADGSPIRFQIAHVPAETGEPTGSTR
ncbi:MAG: hypothetical protein JWO67_2264 [Streptosporangiaceae bacterium]|nr:hypothetical protein [Streptosporangiaceae bacterium]